MNHEHLLQALLLTALVAAGFYVVVITLMTVFQERFVYFPGKKIKGTPADLGLAYEDVSFETADGVSITGWYVPCQDAREVVLFCHGNGGNISTRMETITILNGIGLNVLLFDYRGYGRSIGSPSEEGTYLDAEAAWKFLVDDREFSPDDIVVHGRSLGGAVAAWLAARTTPRALILESAFYSIKRLAREMYPWTPAGLLVRLNYSTADYLRHTTCPVLVIHSPDDTLIPWEHGRDLFDEAPGPKRFLEISGNHYKGFATSGGTYIDGIAGFLREYGAGGGA